MWKQHLSNQLLGNQYPGNATELLFSEQKDDMLKTAIMACNIAASVVLGNGFASASPSYMAPSGPMAQDFFFKNLLFLIGCTGEYLTTPQLQNIKHEYQKYAPKQKHPNNQKDV